MDSFLQMKDRERAAYDHLIYYILNPTAPCVTAKFLGGKMGVNGLYDGDKVVCLEPGPGIGEECIVYSFGYIFYCSSSKVFYFRS